MKKYIPVSLLIILGVANVGVFIFRNKTPSLNYSSVEKKNLNYSSDTKIDLEACEVNLLKYLKFRKDSLALIEADKILSLQSSHLLALWAKAELFRRAYKFKESEDLLNFILSQDPKHGYSLLGLSYIKYHKGERDEALRLLKDLLNQSSLDKENKALAYMLMGSIYAQRASSGGFFSKITYGSRIKGLFKKAKIIQPDSPEVCLGLGSFYLLAPKITGGDIDKAIAELEYAFQLSPDFATVNARLAQTHKKRGDMEKYNFYIQRTKELDPENEVLKEIGVLK